MTISEIVLFICIFLFVWIKIHRGWDWSFKRNIEVLSMYSCYPLLAAALVTLWLMLAKHIQQDTWLQRLTVVYTQWNKILQTTSWVSTVYMKCTAVWIFLSCARNPSVYWLNSGRNNSYLSSWAMVNTVLQTLWRLLEILYTRITLKPCHEIFDKVWIFYLYLHLICFYLFIYTNVLLLYTKALKHYIFNFGWFSKKEHLYIVW